MVYMLSFHNWVSLSVPKDAPWVTHNWGSTHTSLSDVLVRSGGGCSALRGPVGPQRGSEGCSPDVAFCLPPALLLSKDMEEVALAGSGSPAGWAVFLVLRSSTKRSSPFLSTPGGHVCSVNRFLFLGSFLLLLRPLPPP